MSVAGQRGHYTVTLQLGRVAETAADKAPIKVRGRSPLACSAEGIHNNTITSIRTREPKPNDSELKIDMLKKPRNPPP